MKESIDGIPMGVSSWLFCKLVLVPAMFKILLVLALAAGFSGEVLESWEICELDVDLRTKNADF